MGQVRTEVVDGCGIVTLDNPQALNAWSQDMQRAVGTAVATFAADTQVRSVVLTGAGDRAFCSGQDLKELAGFGVDDVATWLDTFQDVYETILSCPKPVVAALNGVAAGSGYQLSLLCDLRVAHEGVRMGQPEVKSGIPSITGMYLTWQSLGHAKTAELMLTGRLVDAQEARDLGLVTEIVPAPQVLARAMERAAELAAQPSHAFQLTKQHLFETLRPGLRAAFAAALDIDKAAYAEGEPQGTAQKFLSRGRDAATTPAS
ncbi:enoyl-CoA hydratase/isomerase family protein [Isoptericola cucumis]|uniref:enoyl-CoA hydratase/isomerase family protein n=1 Tax=Isoptericola cucumis TaxID=1776856 RepID=UPI003208F688